MSDSNSGGGGGWWWNLFWIIPVGIIVAIHSITGQGWGPSIFQAFFFMFFLFAGIIFLFQGGGGGSIFKKSKKPNTNPAPGSPPGVPGVMQQLNGGNKHGKKRK